MWSPGRQLAIGSAPGGPSAVVVRLPSVVVGATVRLLPPVVSRVHESSTKIPDTAHGIRHSDGSRSFYEPQQRVLGEYLAQNADDIRGVVRNCKNKRRYSPFTAHPHLSPSISKPCIMFPFLHTAAVVIPPAVRV